MSEQQTNDGDAATKTAKMADDDVATAAAKPNGSSPPSSPAMVSGLNASWDEWAGRKISVEWLKGEVTRVESKDSLDRKHAKWWPSPPRNIAAEREAALAEQQQAAAAASGSASSWSPVKRASPATVMQSVRRLSASSPLSMASR